MDFSHISFFSSQLVNTSSMYDFFFSYIHLLSLFLRGHERTLNNFLTEGLDISNWVF